MNTRRLSAEDWSSRLGKGYAFTFIVCCLGALAIYLPFLIMDRGLFQYCGDYNSQQIPFYTYMNDFVKSGAGQWSWETDLGTSVITGYAFYLLGSPFFWLSTLLPQAWVPFAMVPLMILKFGVCGLGAFTWLRRYSKTKTYAVIAACLYAFSGFTVYNTFFNHFVDCIALFPFLLWALDAYVYDRQRGVFPLAVAVNCLNNYFFFFGQVVFLLIYFTAKLCCGEYKIRPGAFVRLAFESLLGVALGCLLLIPTMLSLPDNPRTINPADGFGLLLYSRVQQYFAILSSLFFPPDPTYRPNLFTDATIKHTSMTAYLPMVSMVGVWAYCRARPRAALTRILTVCFIMAMVPVLNSAFYAFNSSYYARWYYMPILLMCAATMHTLEESDRIDIWRGIRFTLIGSGLFVLFALVPKQEGDVWSIGVVQDQPRFWLSFLTALLGVVLLAAFWLRLRRRAGFTALLLASVLLFSWFYSVCHIALGKLPQLERDKDYRRQYYDSAPYVQWPDEQDFFRIDTYNENDKGVFDNMGLMMKRPGLRFFHSVVTPSIMDFYPRLGVKRDVSSKPAPDLYALRGLLGVRYIVTRVEQKDEFEQAYQSYGYTFSHKDSTFAFFKNENELPLGFAYDQYLLLENVQTDDGQPNFYTTPMLASVPESSRANMLVRAIALTPDQIQRYGHLMQPVQDAELTDFTYERYVQDVQKRRAQAVYDVQADHTGFRAKITLNKENLVFFSVPFDKGFRAEVNGRPVQIERVSGGMSAVLCPKGASEIRFIYETPGFAAAQAITAGAAVVWAGYVGYSILEKKRRRGLFHWNMQK